MSKLIIFLSLIAFMLTSCDIKDEYEVEKSNTVAVSGEWYVLYNHSVYGPDPFSAGLTQLITFNTSSNTPDSIWLSDEGNFWAYKVKIPCNVDNLTFGGADTVINTVTGYPIKVLVRNGRIIEKISVQPSGFVADSIYFEVWFEDLADATAIESDTLFVSGFRRTGFLEDEP